MAKEFLDENQLKRFKELPKGEQDKVIEKLQKVQEKPPGAPEKIEAGAASGWKD
jgi:mRNA-degrading endonuclease RelE of RelBE toxin-antitoxin system